MAKKHEQIIQHIEALPIGERVSVRKLAKRLHMSEGTAYRAIKDAETLGIVSTIERVGTIRIEKKSRLLPEMLTFEEVLNIIGGKVIGGQEGLNKHLAKFIIGAMTLDAMERYFSNNSLIIVGNRENVHLFALEHDVAVLITGGFSASEEVIQLANERQLPVISTNHDTFTVAQLINRSMADQLIKKEIVTIEDIYTPLEDTYYLTPQHTVQDFYDLFEKTQINCFPVAYNNRLVGVVTENSVINKNDTTILERVMIKSPFTVKTHASIASVSHKMIWEDLQMLPVVEDNLQLLGIVNYKDVKRAMQSVEEPQLVHTLEEEVIATLEEYADSELKLYDYHVTVTPNMINHFGTISYGVLCELITNVAYQQLYEMTQVRHLIEKIDIHYFNLIQMGNEIQLKVTVFNRNRRGALSEVDVYHENTLVAKAVLTSQMIARN